MKKLLTACMLMAIGAPSFAQQWTGTTNLYNTNTDGNVGIGVTNPHGKLTVGGGTNPNPNTGAEVDYAGLNLTFMESTGSDGYDLGIIKMVQPTGYFIDAAHMTFSINSGGTLTERMRIDNNGNIGISTTPIVHKGYTGLSLNNAKNGGYLDFMQAGVRQGYITGDVSGLSLFSPAKKGVHIWSNEVENLTILSNGNVGIYQQVPVARLQVGGTLLMGGGNANLSGLDISFMGKGSGLGGMLMGWNRSAEGESDFIANPGIGTGGYAFYNYSNVTKTAPSALTELMRIRSTGQVLIGVTNFTLSQGVGSNMLAVGGGILTEAVTVKTQGTNGSNWPDYVFKSNYLLPTLKSVETFIDKNHHLPEIPSEADIKKDGQNLGEMNRVLIKKVEQLTLYMIQKDKQLAKEQKINLRQEQLLNAQQKQIDLVKNQIFVIEKRVKKTK